MRVNFGCGKNVLAGFYNIDAIRNKKAPRPPELLHAIKFDGDGQVINPLPLHDNCATEVHAMHVIEHVYAWEAPALVREWRRLLSPGGLLVLELPNILLAAKNLLAGMNDQMCMWPLYGDWGHKDPYMMHKHGYTPATIKQLLADNGFIGIKLLPPRTHKRRINRDMRAEALKG